MAKLYTELVLIFSFVVLTVTTQGDIDDNNLHGFDRPVRRREMENFFQSNCTNGVCYRLFEEKLNWIEANYMCNTFFRDTHHLVTIDSSAVQVSVADLISSTRFNDTERVWIGLKRNTSNISVFDWVDGSNISYTNWYQSDNPLVPSEPSSADEECVNIFMEADKFGYWNDELCAKEHFYMCEGPPVPQPIVTIPQSSYSVIIGDTVTLACNVTSDLDFVDFVSWEKRNADLPELILDFNKISSLSTKYSGSNYSTPSLTIFNVDKSDEGNYMCFAAGYDGIGNSSVIVLTVVGRCFIFSNTSAVGFSMILYCCACRILCIKTFHKNTCNHIHMHYYSLLSLNLQCIFNWKWLHQ
ncbi:uncharacterized protein [Mytilus edulis]|uniref:uncharacterized protein n=1 Tax=Mytilus edulis TaxID=6550 RepID=UPI0039F06275